MVKDNRLGEEEGIPVVSAWKSAKVGGANSGFPAYGIPREEGRGGACSHTQGSRHGRQRGCMEQRGDVALQLVFSSWHLQQGDEG